MKYLILILPLLLLVGCSTTHFYVTDDGFKVAENGSKLQAADFNGSDFFIVNPPNQYYKDLNAFAFYLISDFMIVSNNAQPAYKPSISQKLQKKGEAVLLKNGEAYFVRYDGNQKAYNTYSFLVSVNNDVYNHYCQCISEFKKLKQAAYNCQWVLDNCQNPIKTITRQVSVPRTAYQTVTRSANTHYYGNLYGGATTYYTSVEPYTVYDTKTEYVTIANPDYNPVKVDQARELLPLVQAEINKLDALINELFNRIFIIQEAASNQNTVITNPSDNLSTVTLEKSIIPQKSSVTIYST